MESPSRSSDGKAGPRSRLDLLVSVLLAVACASVAVVTVLDYFERRRPVKVVVGPPANAAGRGAARLPTEPVSVSNLAMRGSPMARVGVIEFSDFECQYCAVFTKHVLPALDREYVRTERIFFAFKHLPLDGLHRSASIAATAAECSRRQGRFWEMHDWLFSNQSTLGDLTIRQGARILKLESTSFDACMSGDGRESVARDIKNAKAIGVTGTPTFLIGTSLGDGKMRIVSILAGARPFEEFKRVLDRLLAEPATKP